MAETQGKEFGKILGFGKIFAKLANPTQEQLEVKLKYKHKDEDTKYYGIDKNGIPWFMCKVYYGYEGYEFATENTMAFISKTPKMKGKTEESAWIDASGNWGFGLTAKNVEYNKKANKKAFDIKSARQMYKGEDEFMNLYKSFTGKSITLDNKDWDALFNGNKTINVNGKDKSINDIFIGDKPKYITALVGGITGISSTGKEILNAILYSVTGTEPYIISNLNKTYTNNKGDIVKATPFTIWNKDTKVNDPIKVFGEFDDKRNIISLDPFKSYTLEEFKGEINIIPDNIEDHIETEELPF